MHGPSPRHLHLPRLTSALIVVVIVALVASPAPAFAAASPGSNAATSASPNRPASPAGPASLTGSAAQLTDAQALAQAELTGTPVAVTGATTANSTLTANPNGTFTLTSALNPQRKYIAGAWTALDTTLRTNPDATISPTVAYGGLTLSGGGTAPLATMADTGRSLSLTLPFALPTPTLSGPTATYANVLPGVDLIATADTTGGFSEVLVIHDATAAANPQLNTLTFATRTTGLTMATDTGGTITGTDHTGRVVISAPAPVMWDSHTATTRVATVPDKHTGQALDASNGMPVDSSAGTPGEAANVARLGVAVTPTSIALTPNAVLMASPTLTYPTYVDPTYSWTSPTPESGWANIQSGGGANTDYWKTGVPLGSGNTDLLSGYVPSGGGDISRSLMSFTVDTTTLSGATIGSAVLDITENWAWNCTPQKVDIYAPAKDLTSTQASWNDWSGAPLGSLINEQNVAYGYTGCAAHGVSFNIATAIAADVSSGNKSQTFLIRANNEGTQTQWKRFDSSTPHITITYDHTPDTPTNLTTSPSTSCATVKTVGDSPVELDAPVTDRDGGNASVYFSLWKTSDASKTRIWPTNGNPIPGVFGQTARTTVPEATLKTASGGSNPVVTEFSWHVQVKDSDSFMSAWSGTCNFNFDATRPGKPDVALGGAATIGVPLSVTVTPPGSGTLPTSYLYQLNSDAPVVVAAPTGTVTFSVTPSRITNLLMVNSLSAGQNLSDDAARVEIDAAPGPTAIDGDMTGDGTADLIAVGAANGLPAGLWVARGNGTGVNTAASNIGVNGNGTGTANPADFTGAQVITGHFFGVGTQDVIAYYPTGLNTGLGIAIAGQADGTPLRPVSGLQVVMFPGTFTDNNGDNPIQIANAANSAGLGLAYPDLIATSGDTTTGYYLDYYPNQNSIGGYPLADQLGTSSPDGSYDWNLWTIASAQAGTGTYLYLWKPSTGALYLWTNLAHTPSTNDLTFSAYTLRASGWNTSGTLSLRAADINKDGTPDLWTVGAGGVVTANLVTNLTGGTGTITAQTAQTLVTPKHTWRLNDQVSGAVVATDNATSGALAVTGGGNAAWGTSDVFDPDVTLDGTNSYAATTGAAIGSGSFTVSAWVRLGAASTVYRNALSQEGAHTSLFGLGVNNANQWTFWWHPTDNTSPALNEAKSTTAAAVHVWTHLVGVFNSSGNQMSLYVNGTLAATATAVTPWTPTGAFAIGRGRWQDANGYFFNGSISGVQTFPSALTAAQVTAVYNQYAPPAPPPSGTSISYVASAAAMGTFTSVTATIPAAVQSNDVMLMFFTTPSTETITPPSGWTLAGQTPTSFTSLFSFVWYRVATATDAGTSATVTYGTTAHKASLQIVAYRGVKTSTPIGAINNFTTTVSVSSVTSPTVTVTNAGSWLVTNWTAKSSVITGWTAPAGQTVRSVNNGTGSGYLNAIVTDLNGPVATGTAGGYTATTDQVGGSDVAWTVALNLA
jgi:hypothetical protein